MTPPAMLTRYPTAANTTSNTQHSTKTTMAHGSWLTSLGFQSLGKPNSFLIFAAILQARSVVLLDPGPQTCTGMMVSLKIATSGVPARGRKRWAGRRQHTFVQLLARNMPTLAMPYHTAQYRRSIPYHTVQGWRDTEVQKRLPHSLSAWYDYCGQGHGCFPRGR